MGWHRRKQQRTLFKTEADLCDALIRDATRERYAVHPETSEWDVLLVDPATGLQVGIEAKLRPNVEVLSQAVRKDERQPGPDVHAVLVPNATAAFTDIAERLRILVLDSTDLFSLKPAYFGTRLSYDLLRARIEQAPRWSHPSRAWVPENPVVVTAGTPSPRRVTEWKIAAVKLCVRTRERGYATSADMKELKLSKSFWFQGRLPLFEKHRDVAGKPIRGQYVFRDPGHDSHPDRRWPEITASLVVKVVVPAPRKHRLRVRVAVNQ